ncbi:uncharacterized protein CCOS01_11877 [Colletotrichum costaricense]|uniref:Uncharacterized protein n=1 Tax=Colletotrichum costaricense TaxID=1209916 RepID=A0AAI9YN81_9PEZI|nr:uncharacterized protein CCOS01_11877 [Colletotrichum costaricense]KAK1517620.1 hypothetical protein CCOS01_11877 [Colletotrichum costaricense]
MSWLWLPQDLYCELPQSDGHFLGKVTRMTVPAKRISSFSTCHPALILKDTGIDKRSEVLLHRDTPLANPLFEMDDIDSTVIETSSSPKHEIRPEQIISLIIAPISSCLLAYLLLVLFTYLFSCLFVFGSWVFQLLFLAELRMDFIPCSAAGILCLTAYVVIKLVYLFMVDKAHVIRGTTKSRLKSKLYVFNAFVMLAVYGIIATFNFVSRGSRYDKENDVCSIGLERTILLPVIFFDAVVNVYLTSLFLFPLLRLHSIQISMMKPWTMHENTLHFSRVPPNVRLRRLALRTFAGVIGTLAISIANLSVLVALEGEIVWLCLTCCNTDILFTAFVIHWINSSGKATPISNVEVAPTPAPPPPSIELGEKEVVTFTEIFDQRRKSYDDHEP